MEVFIRKLGKICGFWKRKLNSQETYQTPTNAMKSVK